MARSHRHPQHACESCGYTWYPPNDEGSSTECPSCHSFNIRVGQHSLSQEHAIRIIMAGALIFLVFLFVVCMGLSYFRRVSEDAKQRRQQQPTTTPISKDSATPKKN